MTLLTFIWTIKEKRQQPKYPQIKIIKTFEIGE
jgi:hypothetical protein